MTISAFSSADSSWTVGERMPTKRLETSAVTLDDKIYVIAGGPEPGGAGSDVNEIFQSRNSANHILI